MSVRKIEQSLMLSLSAGQQLHLRRLADNPKGPAVLLLHGMMEDGTIFYSSDGMGLANYLAEQGYDTYIPDLRGKGRSWPPVSRWATYRVSHAVNQDLPAILEAIYNIRGDYPEFWVNHAWGGVLASSFLARFPTYRATVNGLVNFGTHRVSTSKNLSRFIWVDGLWGWLGGMFARFKGYIPGRTLLMGAQDEFLGIQQDSFNWLKGKAWVDPSDQFDYGKAISQGLDYPPALYFAACSDFAYCSAGDVKGYINEVGSVNGRLVVLGKSEGNQQNYSHTTMLTHPDAKDDHFSQLLSWMKEMGCLRKEAQGKEEMPKIMGDLVLNNKQE